MLLHKFGLDFHYFIDYLSTNNLFVPIVGCEVGVQKGYNAVYMLENLPLKRLYLVDNDSEGYVKYSKMVLSKYMSNCDLIFLKCESVDAVSCINEPLDYVYIDGGHDSNTVYNDISNYYYLVKRGGFLGGHDFQTPTVTKGLMDFCSEYNILPTFKGRDWWFMK